MPCGFDYVSDLNLKIPGSILLRKNKKDPYRDVISYFGFLSGKF